MSARAGRTGPDGRRTAATAGSRSRTVNAVRRPWIAVCALLLALLASPAAAGDLVVAGSTDRAAMQPFLEAFTAANPDVAVRYLEEETVELYRGVAEARRTPVPDVLISSAADLQVRLVNDGHARPWRSAATARLPAWARWRDEAFGFTFEPLVLVVNAALLPRENRPRTREALGRLIGGAGVEAPKVATYDVEQSGVGYLAASFDALTMSDYWPFVERISGSGLLTACCTSQVLDMVASGRALVGYNVIGPYARARAAVDARIAIVVPEDFTTAITRVAVLTRAGAHPREAERFLDFLLSPAAQALAGDDALLPPGGPGDRALSPGPVRPIPLDASLLALTDPMRRSRFIELWTGVTSGR